MALETRDELLAGRYRRLRTLGTGGMARVYLAEDERLGRQVAIKQLHANSPEDAALRFQREAKLGASLNHPNLVSIYDIETEGESILIVMEYVEGETLQDAIAKGALPPKEVARIVRDIASGLDHAHAHGVVHRDVKPANILIRRDGMAKLADLGIATAAESTSITHSGVVMGTASYMAPEQLGGGKAGPRTDVYALAAVAFEALSGAKARSGKTPVEIAHEVVSGPPPDLRDALPQAAPEAADALARGMAREPDDRPATAGALAADLDRGLRARRRQAERTVATAPMRPPAVARPRRGTPSWLGGAAAALAILALAVGGVLALGGDGDDGSPSRDAAAERGPSSQGGSSKQSRTDGQDGQSGQGSGGTARGDGQDSPGSSSGGDGSAGAVPTAAPAPTTDDPVALNDQGYDLIQAGDPESAIPLLERAVAAYPEGSQELTYAYALYNLGHALRLAGRPDEAIPILERRLAIPNQTETVQRELDAARAAAG